MRTNFRIVDMIYCVLDGQDFDMHNDYDFHTNNYDEAERILILEWKKSTGDWVKKDNPAAIIFTHEDVSFLNISRPEDAQQTLEWLTFYPPSEREENDRYMSQETANENDDIIYQFTDESFIRVGASKVIVQIVY